MITVYELLKIWISLIFTNIALSYILTYFIKSNFWKKLLYICIVIGIVLIARVEYCIPFITLKFYMAMIIELYAVMGMLVVHYNVLSDKKIILHFYILIILSSLPLMAFVQDREEIVYNTLIICIIFFINVVLTTMVSSRSKSMKELELSCIITSLIVTMAILIVNFLGIYVRWQENTLKDSVVILWIVDVILAVMGNVLRDYIRKAEYNISQIQHSYDRDDIDRVNRMYEEARKLRHDLKHCVVTIKGYIKEKQYEKADQFLDQLVDERIEAFGYVKYCNNQVLNYMINDKFEQCRKLGIIHKCIVMGEIPELDDIELSILLGNLLDNAIEAANKCSEKRIDLQIYSKTNLNICIENSIKDSVLIKKTPFFTTKLDYLHHGFGIKSIYDIVGQYNGEICYEENDGMMICNVLLLYKKE